MAKYLQLVVLSLFVAWAVAQSCSDNPLLKRADIQARFGGSTNVRTSASAAGSSLPVCKYLQGKSSCVTDAGYSALASNIQSQKDTIVSEGANKNKRFANISSLADRASDCYANAAAFLALQADLASGWANANTKLQIRADTYNGVWATYSALLNQQLSDFRGYARNVTALKATCARNLIRYYTFVSCEASNPDYSATVSGSSENPSTKVKSGFCSTVASDCRGYIQGLKHIAEGQAEITAACDSDMQSFGGKLRRNETVTQAELLALATKLGVSLSGETNFPIVGSKVNCGSSCNFVCNSVFTGVGFRVNAFTDLNPDSSTRLLQSGSGSFQESSSAKDPVELTKDDNTEVAKESDSMGSSAAGLIVNIVMVMLAAFLTL